MMKKTLAYSFENLENYVKNNLTFNVNKGKSEEFYFGENNPLKTRLIANITHMREVASDVYVRNRFAKPIDVLQELKLIQDELRQTIIEEFNIEGCSIGWWNATNAACYCQFANSDLYGKGDSAKDLNFKLNDIVINDSTGFHYRNKKGIYYCIVLGYNIFAVDNLFTVEEAAAILTHELGHAMQHMVNSLNQCVSLAQFQYLLTCIEPNIEYLTPEDRKYVRDFMRRYRDAKKRNDKATLDALGKELLESFNPNDGISFSKADDNYITEQSKSNWNKDTSKSDEKRIKNPKAKGFFKTLFSAIGSIVSAPFLLLFAVPSMIGMSKTLKNKSGDIHACKMFEEAADNFCSIYGLGPYQASCMKKFANLGDSYTRTAPRFFERIPLLDLSTSFNELYADYGACLSGYPTDKQRAINLYKAAEFELKNNKELSADAKRELQNQIDQYKKLYEEFVKNESTKGFFYKILAGIKRESIEEAAKKDKLVEEHVLIPLQQKADPKFDPNDLGED